MLETPVLEQETYLRALRLLEAAPQLNQRALALELGMSLGKTNYCLKALVQRGWVTAERFHNSQRKLAYAYLLTPAGIAEKSVMAARFLKRKMDDYEALKSEIDRLQQEAVREAKPAQGSNQLSMQAPHPAALSIHTPAPTAAP
jgi:EPS-associated MarR family transcriptional regulator